MIKIENLTVTYNQTPALSNINLEITGPGITGIIGPNGAGKSTLIKAILNIIPSTGIAKIDDKISKENLDNVAYVEQKINIDYNFPIKVRECVSLGLYSKIGILKKLKKSDWQKVDDALKLVGLEKFSNRQISELSGGAIPTCINSSLSCTRGKVYIFRRTLCWYWLSKWRNNHGDITKSSKYGPYDINSAPWLKKSSFLFW